MDLAEKYAVIEHNGVSVVDNIVDTKIASSIVHGFGLFALKAFPKDSLLTYLSGQFLPDEFIQSIDTPTQEWNAVSEHIFCYRWVRTKYGYINHSRDLSNCLISFDYPVVQLKTSRNIEIGEELFLDYQMEHLPAWYTE